MQTEYTRTSIYAYLLNKFKDISEIINIEDFSISRQMANNLLTAFEASLKNINIDFDQIIVLVTDSPSVILETNELEEIYAEVEENLSNSFLEQLFNFNIEELILESNEANMNTNQTRITSH
ncbi:6730_t:CDS:2 [Dentiscutata erythropus]|uniref:6730_t:CDS:1 n=1 Tax=Dentiscutata erythropus TaxID=1348616 RepID=A0A9N8W4R6_9GLOM|nr:6730_t:CDS:2 [Dentiscutata erythropus]